LNCGFAARAGVDIGFLKTLRVHVKPGHSLILADELDAGGKPARKAKPGVERVAGDWPERRDYACSMKPNLAGGISLFLCLLASPFAAASNPVTGNGFGFAVVNPSTATVVSFYPHPYSFVRPDEKKPLSEGIQVPNFVSSLALAGAPIHDGVAEYEDDSQVIHIHSSEGEGQVYMPFGLGRPVLIASWEASGANAELAGFAVEWKQQIESLRIVRNSGVDMQLVKFDGVEEALLLIPLRQEHSKLAGSHFALAGCSAWAMISLENENEWQQAASDFFRWKAGLSPIELVKREFEQVNAWRVNPTVHFKSENERHLWRQSEVLLRMAQCREPNSTGFHGNGLIVASLPDGAWFTPWVRDMAWATVAFARMGHRAEARAAVLAYFNAQPTGKMKAQTAGADYQISVVRYFGDGAEEPFFTEEGNTNIEFDDWGEALWVLGEYLRETKDTALLAERTYRGPLYESARDFIGKPLLANLESFGHGEIVAEDTSIWEEHQKDQKHFAFSTAAAIFGLRDFAEVAGRKGDTATQTRILKELPLIQTGFDEAFIRDGTLHGTLEEGVKNDIDGALMPIINFGVVTDPGVIRSTVDRMKLLKVASGGYRRVRGTYTDPAIFEYWYEQEEFVFVDLSLAEVYRRMGRTAEADAMLKRVVDKAAVDHNLIPEMYVAVDCKLFHGSLGDPTGALPMAGYGAGAYILHLIEREKLDERH
jgi:GH15 family glucan-1,4-alpha-glucosidase